LADGDPVFCRAKDVSIPFAGMTRIRFKGSPRRRQLDWRPSVSQPLDGTPLGHGERRAPDLRSQGRSRPAVHGRTSVTAIL
jgi:hypothetical protein